MKIAAACCFFCSVCLSDDSVYKYDSETGGLILNGTTVTNIMHLCQGARYDEVTPLMNGCRLSFSINPSLGLEIVYNDEPATIKPYYGSGFKFSKGGEYIAHIVGPPHFSRPGGPVLYEIRINGKIYDEVMESDFGGFDWKNNILVVKKRVGGVMQNFEIKPSPNLMPDIYPWENDLIDEGRGPCIEHNSPANTGKQTDGENPSDGDKSPAPKP